VTTEAPLTACPVEQRQVWVLATVTGIPSSSFQIVCLLAYMINTAIYVTNGSNVQA